MNKSDYPALWQFLGGYLHQDWQDDYADPSEALSDFMVSEPAVASDIAPEIDRLLASTRTSDEAEVVILDLGSFYVPSRSGQDSRGWLVRIRAEAARTLQAG